MSNGGQDSSTADDDDRDMFNGPVQSLFHGQYTLAKQVCTGKAYVLHLRLNRTLQTVAGGLSDGSVGLYDAESLVRKSSLSAHAATSTLTGIRFVPNNEHLMLTGAQDEPIKLWDVRTDMARSEALRFDDTGVGCPPKPLTSFDVNSEGLFLSAGTEQVKNDSFLLFWDLRRAKLLGGYWNTFGDDIRQVAFDHSLPNLVAVSVDDGSISVFDISRGHEDDALLSTVSCSTSAAKLKWLRRRRHDCPDEPWIAAVLDDEQVMMWRPALDEQRHEEHLISREDVTVGIKRYNTAWTYVIDVHDTSSEPDQPWTLLAGSSWSPRPCLRMLRVGKRMKLKPLADLSDPDGALKNTLVRCGLITEGNQAVYTGSEDGYLSLWTSINQ